MPTRMLRGWWGSCGMTKVRHRWISASDIRAISTAASTGPALRSGTPDTTMSATQRQSIPNPLLMTRAHTQTSPSHPVLPVAYCYSDKQLLLFRGRAYTHHQWSPPYTRRIGQWPNQTLCRACSGTSQPVGEKHHVKRRLYHCTLSGG